MLRTAVALAAVTGRPVRIDHVRAGRKNPGLRPQHLTAVRAAAAVCRARLEGDELGSQILTFTPSDAPCAGEYLFDVAGAAKGGSAGSVGLVLQAVLVPLVLSRGESRVTLLGGTHVPWAPPATYIEHVFLPTVSRMGIDARLEVGHWGFYPAGGGDIRVQIAGTEMPPRPISLVERGELERAWGIAAVMNLPAHIPQRMAACARNALSAEGIRAQIEPRRLRGAGPGAGIFLFAKYAQATAGFAAYGQKGVPAEHVAEAACAEFLMHHSLGRPADPHLADQLALPASLANGESRIETSRISRHLLTSAWVIQQFLERKIRVEGELGMPGALVVGGAS